ncbi:MAG: MBL fold metallo-hydrolase [Patescibacteria group bacterium]|jgi:L-ascorbate metabolism protein UlaG (beta-lactamase superfamily)
MKITKYPQSAILIEENDKKILIDPGSYCYNDNFSANNWGKIDILLITHEHGDHFQPEAIKIIKENNPNLRIFTNRSVKTLLDHENINSEILESEQEINVLDFNIKGVKSTHGQPPNGSAIPEVIGFLINNRIYHPGDTLYLDEKPQAEILFVPICGVVVMNPEEATKFTEAVGAKVAIPIHYDSPMFPVDVNDFAKTCPIAKILKNGESITW